MALAKVLPGPANMSLYTLSPKKTSTGVKRTHMDCGAVHRITLAECNPILGFRLCDRDPGDASGGESTCEGNCSMPVKSSTTGNF
jgi:hypothetical protein